MKQTKDKRPKTKDQKNIEISCLPSLIRINQKNVRIILGKILQLFDLKTYSISVVFCDNVFIRKLNRKFFKKSNPTDVISFPLHDTINPDYLGEIVISAEQAKKICNFYGKRWQEELVLYLIHGVLHLIGYNDINKKERARMERKQEEIFAKLLKRYRKAIFDIG